MPRLKPTSNAAKRSHKKKARPSTPEEIAARKAAQAGASFDAQIVAVISADGEATPSQWGIDREQVQLPTASDVKVQLGPARSVARARRQSVFDQLAVTKQKDGSTVLDERHTRAVERLAEDLAVRAATCGASSPGKQVVDESRRGDPMDGRLAAGERIDAVLSMTGLSSARLLVALLNPGLLETILPVVLDDAGQRVPDTGAPWRRIVAIVTGVRYPAAQATPIVIACENLVGAYAAWDAGEARGRNAVRRVLV